MPKVILSLFIQFVVFLNAMWELDTKFVGGLPIAALILGKDFAVYLKGSGYPLFECGFLVNPCSNGMSRNGNVD